MMQDDRFSRRSALAAAAGVAAATGLAGHARAQSTSTDVAEFLFVQTADGMLYDAKTGMMTLTDVSPVTLFFADRPERLAGNMNTSDFVPFWSEGTDSFLSDPPNADVSILEGNQLKQSVVVLKAPVLQGGDLVYLVELVSGELPTEGRDVSVFIDIIGMPLTPLSFAGVRRRAYRRAFLYR